jgi:hypothetical protein
MMTAKGFLICAALGLSASPAFADDSELPTVPDVVLTEEIATPGHEVRVPANANPAAAAPSRRKSIEFEDDVVEGMKNDPLGSLQPFHKRGQGGERLYRVKPSFRREINRTTTEMGYGK